MDHTALLLIDLQRDFLEVNGRMAVSVADASQVVSLANRLIQHGVSAGWKLIFIKNGYPKSDLIGNLFPQRRGDRGFPWGGAGSSVIVPFSGLVLTKSRPDAFTNPELEETLTSGAVHQLVVLGVMAEGCVRATVKGATSRGFGVTVVSDAVASSRGLFWRFGVRSMKNAGAIAKVSSEILGLCPSPP